MNEAFKVGSVYRNRDGANVIVSHDPACKGAQAGESMAFCNALSGEGMGICHLSDGTSVFGQRGYDLIPGELVLRDGAWVAVEEAKDEPTSYAEAVRQENEMYEINGLAGLIRKQQLDPNAAMIARDGPAKPRVTVERWPSLDAMTLTDKPFTSTAKPALAALTRSPDLSEAKHQISTHHALAAGRSSGGW